MRVVFDLDGTICEEKPTFERALAKPFPKVVEYINKLHDEGTYIIIYSARGWAELVMTENWLKENGVPYDLLILGKPIYDVWYDDRAENLDMLVVKYE